MIHGKINPNFKWVLLAVIILWILIGSFVKADTELTEESIRIQTAQQTIESTVKIAIIENGSGFFVAENLIITNEHVIRNEKKWAVPIETYDGTKCVGKLEYQSTNPDLALLSTECKGKPLTLTETHSIGQSVLAVGNPDIYDFIVSRGIVSGHEWNMIIFDAPVNPGNSGGPLVNLKGEVIGIVKGRDKNIHSIGAAVSAKEINKFLERAK